MIKTIFLASNHPENENELELYSTDENKIFISVGANTDNPYSNGCITLDKYTAVKLSRHLRREIAKLNSEDYNG